MVFYLVRDRIKILDWDILILNLLFFYIVVIFLFKVCYLFICLGDIWLVWVLKLDSFVILGNEF